MFLEGNMHTKALVMTHDLRTFYDVHKIFEEIINRCNQKGYPRSATFKRFEMRKCFLQALFPQKCRLTSSKLHGEFPHYCISSSGTLSGAGEESLQAYKVY